MGAPALVICVGRVPELVVLPANSGCFGQFWVWPREFYIRRVRFCVLPVSCISFVFVC